MVFTSDVLIIGAGVVGCATARALSRYQCSVTVLDRGCDVAEGATKANSGIVHAGYDAVPGTKKAFYNVRGAEMMSEVCRTLGVPYDQCGALVIGFSPEDRDHLARLLDRGVTNGVSGLRIIEDPELHELEPNLNPEAKYALLVPTSGIVSPYELAFALADHAALNGVSFRFHEAYLSVSREAEGFIVQTRDHLYHCRVLINCAGASSADLHTRLSGEPLKMIHRRGQYYLLDRAVAAPFKRTIFQCPSVMGKGVLVSPTVHGNVLLGPSAEDIGDPLDTATTQEGLDFVLSRARRTWPGVSTRLNITNFSGVRAHLEGDDFLVGPVAGVPGAFEAAGIESPGLSSAPAIGQDLAVQVAAFLGAAEKEAFVPALPLPTPFRELSPEAQREALRNDPAHGNIVCRCEVVTEADIRAAIRRPVGATTIDGVKRRTRAGMGRCQGGFCSPRVAAIIAEETGISMLDVTKDGGDSRLLAGTVEAFLNPEEGGAEHA